MFEIAIEFYFVLGVGDIGRGGFEIYAWFAAINNYPVDAIDS